MPKAKQWICSALLIVVSVAPALAGKRTPLTRRLPQKPQACQLRSPQLLPAPA